MHALSTTMTQPCSETALAVTDRLISRSGAVGFDAGYRVSAVSTEEF